MIILLVKFLIVRIFSAYLVVWVHLYLVTTLQLAEAYPAGAKGAILELGIAFLVIGGNTSRSRPRGSESPNKYRIHGEPT